MAESLDARTLGNVFHHVMEELYGGKAIVTTEMIRTMMSDVRALKSLIRRKIIEELKTIEVSGRNLILEEVILDYVLSTLRHDAGLLAGTPDSGGFRIIGLEKHLTGTFNGFKIHGYADRIDSYRPREVRIVDYKTGKVEIGRKVDEKIALQLFVYDLLCHQDHSFDGQLLVNSIYSMQHMYTGALPDISEDPEQFDFWKNRLGTILSEITDLAVPWHHAEDAKTCATCDFRDICGR